MGLFMEFKKTDNRLLIGFRKFSEQEKILLMKKILFSLSEYDNIQYLVRINGLEVTIDDFVEKILSKNYQYIREVKGRFFIKELANIYLLTNNEQDMCTLAMYFGAVNEGYINIEVLNCPEEVDIRESLPDNFEKFILRNRIMEILIEPDGDALNINNCNTKSDLLKISSAICEIAFK